MKKFISFISALLLAVTLYACGGGGGTVGAAGPTKYFAGISIGDSGELTVDTVNLTYSLTITNSSYGLDGQTLTGSLTKVDDTTYSVTGTTYGKIFVYDNYSVMPLKIDPTDTRYQDYFAKHPYITKSFYVPVIALKKSSLLSTTDAVTSSNQSFEFRSADYYQSIVSGTTTDSVAISRGVVTKVSDTVFSVRYCGNEGLSSKNTQLQTANCTNAIAKTITFTYDTTSQTWLVTPVDPAHSSQVIRASFVKDSVTNQVVGYIDTADATKNSAGFSLVAIAPANAAIPISTANSATFTGYQLCISDGNCAATGTENGVFYTNNLPRSTSNPTVQDTSDGCRSTETDDSPSNGFFEGVWGPGSGACTQTGKRPDTAGFFIGQSTANGKGRSLIAIVGYDTTVTATPSVKLTIGNIVEN